MTASPIAVRRGALGTRWAYQTGLWQPRQPAFWAFALFLLAGAAVFAVLQVVFAVTSPVGWSLSWVLIALFAVPVAILLRKLDLYEREPSSLLIGALLWGGLVATSFSILASGWDVVVLRVFGPEFAAEWGPAITAPVIEELYKALGIVFIALIARNEIDDLMDGFVYGAMVGLGFTIVEDVLYFMAFGGGVGDVLLGFYVRTIAGGVYGHLLYSGLAGIGIAYFLAHRGDRPLASRLLVALGLLGLAIAAHFVWNSPVLSDLGENALVDIWIYHAIKSVPFFLVLVFAVRLARRRERRWIAEALGTEVGRSGLTPDELAVLTDDRRRRAARSALRAQAGPAAVRAFDDLVREQINLAMTRARVGSYEHPESLRQRALCRSLRDRLLAMPGASAALGLSPDRVAALGSLPPEPALAFTFAPDVQVGPVAALAWESPDVTAAAAQGVSDGAKRRPPVALPPGLPLGRLDAEGPLVRVVASNGWLGWLEGTALVPLAPLPVVAPAAVVTPAAGGMKAMVGAGAPPVGAAPAAMRAVAAPWTGNPPAGGVAGLTGEPVSFGGWRVVDSRFVGLGPGDAVGLSLAPHALRLESAGRIAEIPYAEIDVVVDGAAAWMRRSGYPFLALTPTGFVRADALAAEVTRRRGEHPR